MVPPAAVMAAAAGSQLRAATDVGDLKVDQIRGKAPIQFAFTFHWIEGGRHED